LPDYGHKITVDHLLTHTSGIRDWQPLLNLAGGDPDAMTMILRQRELNFAPGEEWSYSNSGYVLLPEIVARVIGMPFSEFARKRLFEQLGMKMTTYVDDPLNLIKNRALALPIKRRRVAGRWTCISAKIAQALAPSALMAHPLQAKIHSSTRHLTRIIAADIMPEQVMRQNHIARPAQNLGRLRQFDLR